jgi:hypothetical protein
MPRAFNGTRRFDLSSGKGDMQRHFQSFQEQRMIVDNQETRGLHDPSLHSRARRTRRHWAKIFPAATIIEIVAQLIGNRLQISLLRNYFRNIHD